MTGVDKELTVNVLFNQRAISPDPDRALPGHYQLKEPLTTDKGRKPSIA
jgi:hypothetical protein